MALLCKLNTRYRQPSAAAMIMIQYGYEYESTGHETMDGVIYNINGGDNAS